MFFELQVFSSTADPSQHPTDSSSRINGASSRHRNIKIRGGLVDRWEGIQEEEEEEAEHGEETMGGEVAQEVVGGITEGVELVRIEGRVLPRRGETALKLMIRPDQLKMTGDVSPTFSTEDLG